MKERNLAEELFLYQSVFGSQEWKALEKRENTIGADVLLDEIINRDEWSNVEMMWVIKQMIYHYGKKDRILKSIPVERLFTNFCDVLRTLYLVIDLTNPDMDVNMRKYLSAKLADSTWGINNRTREYLYKIAEKN
jgi:hypothetical protein